MEGSSLRAVARAGMARECQVRICERLGVNSPGLLGKSDGNQCACIRSAFTPVNDSKLAGTGSYGGIPESTWLRAHRSNVLAGA
jgi:hypothetical protein